MNYKEEQFLNIDENLHERLDEISNQIHTQLISPGQYVVFNEHQKFGRREFQKFWQHISPNNENGNIYSKNEHKGIYAFGEISNGKLRILYIGISQTIRRRFFKHTTTKSKNGATWAYTMLKHQNPDLTKEERQLLIPEIQNSLIKNCRFTFVKEDNNHLMHWAEVYCANKLKSFWNSFETH